MQGANSESSSRWHLTLFVAGLSASVLLLLVQLGFYLDSRLAAAPPAEEVAALKADVAMAFAHAVGLDGGGPLRLGNLTVTGASLGPEDVVLRGRGGSPERDVLLRITRQDDTRRRSGLSVMWEGQGVRLLARAEDRELLRATRAALEPHVGKLRWDSVRRERSLERLFGLANWAALPFWVLLGLASWLLVSEARRAGSAEGEGRVWPILVAVVLLEMGLSAGLGLAYPIAYVEMFRLDVSSWQHILSPLLVTPFELGQSDPHAVYSAANWVMSAAVPVVVALLGVRLFGRLPGLVAGVLAATSPLALRFSLTGDSTVAAGLFLALACLATAVAAARQTRYASLAAGIFWAIAFHGRPEAVAYTVVLVPWALRDERLRGVFRQRALRWAFVVPMLVSLVPAAASVLHALLTETGASIVTETPLSASYWAKLLPTAWTGFVNPRHHYPVFVLAWGAALLLPRQRFRWMLFIGGVLLPALCNTLDGTMAVFPGTSFFSDTHVRRMLLGAPFLYLLAASLLGRLWVWSGRSRRARPLARAVAVGALAAAFAAPVVCAESLRERSPLQAEAEFLLDHADELADCSSIAVAGRPDAEDVRQLHYRLDVLARKERERDPEAQPRPLLSLRHVAQEPVAAGGRPCYYRGLADYLGWHGDNDPETAHLLDSLRPELRARRAVDWRAYEPVAGGQAELRLYVLHPASDGRPAVPDGG